MCMYRCLFAERVGEMKSSSEAKRLRLDSQQDDSNDEEEEDEPAPVTKETTLSREEEQKLAVAKSGRTLEERQKDFKDMLLEREVSNKKKFPLFCVAIMA